MCGFVGIFSPHRRIDTAEIDIHAGTRSIRHRGPDADGYYIAEDGRYQVGFRRLSIIDLDGSDQPIQGADGKRILTGNGEIYNYLELRNQFPNYPYRTRGDMEVVLAAQEALGNEFVHALNGMFSLALYDEGSRELILVRDPLGVKPLFWARLANGGIGFASEPRALFAAGMLEPAIDITQVPNYFAHGYVPAPNTIFQNVYKLQPGHHLRVGADGGMQSDRYWRARDDVPLPKSREGIIEVLSERFRESVRRQLRSDVPLGALLSGGIDSGLLVAMAASEMDRPLKTLSVGFEGADYNELPSARRVAERYGTDHDEVVVNIDVAERLLPNVVWHGGEPFNDAALIPNYLVEQEMSQKAKVVLNGTGGDEIFAGYGRYFPLTVERAYRALPRPLRKYVLGPLISAVSEDVGWKFRRAEKFISAPGEYLHEHSTQFPPHLISRLGLGYTNLIPAQETYFADFDGDRQTGFLYADISTYLPNDLLALLDTTTMAFGLEGRVPFLDPELVNTALSVPQDIRTPGDRSKGIERDMARPLLPEEVIHAPKQGFVSPVPAWFTGDLLRTIMTILTRPKTLARGWWTEGGIKVLAANPARHGYRLYSMLVLEIIADLFVDRRIFESPPGITLSELL